MSYKCAQDRNRRLKKLYNETKHSYGAGAWFNEDKHRYIKYSCNIKSYKIRCRRATRRRMAADMNEFIPRGNYYRRYYDYWWEVT